MLEMMTRLRSDMETSDRPLGFLTFEMRYDEDRLRVSGYSEGLVEMSDTQAMAVRNMERDGMLPTFLSLRWIASDLYRRTTWADLTIRQPRT